MSRRVFDTAALEDGLVLDSARGDAIDALLSAGSRGVYLWGGVGRGKSWLMDVYFAALPTERKRRLHFHEFLADLHSAVRRHRCDLDAALDELLAGLDVVCFDEFHVHDPADGIFVGRLSAALFERNVLVVLTSNYPPDGLLPNPLFHEGFVPTIELIERSLTVVGVNGPVDYRTVRSRHDTGFAAGAWISPGNDIQLSALGLHRPGTSERRVLRPAGHPLPAQRVRPDCLWFDFRDLCGGTTAPVDYLALAEQYPRWVVSGVSFAGPSARETAQRFANLVDVLYDRSICAVFVADQSWDGVMSSAARLPVDIERITSRLGLLRRFDEVAR